MIGLFALRASHPKLPTAKPVYFLFFLLPLQESFVLTSQQRPALLFPIPPPSECFQDAYLVLFVCVSLWKKTTSSEAFKLLIDSFTTFSTTINLSDTCSAEAVVIHINKSNSIRFFCQMDTYVQTDQGREIYYQKNTLTDDHKGHKHDPSSFLSICYTFAQSPPF